MIGHRNERAAKVSANPKNVLYNFVCRLLLERVTQYVSLSAERHEIDKPVLRIVMSSRRGHHFGRFKAYVQQLINQSTAGSTFLNTRSVDAKVLRWEEIMQLPATRDAGLQLADCLVSSFFQSIEQSSPQFEDKTAKILRPLMAERPKRSDLQASYANEGVTLYPATKAAHFLVPSQLEFFSHFGYDLERLKQRSGMS
ncbi:MAG: hypothetical protein HWE37_20085 [Rhodobacteraceae bacterium]|nr:hypothetical protein [Paracoccaceae bacterium]